MAGSKPDGTIEEIRYEGPTRSVDDVRGVIDEFLTEAERDPSVLDGLSVAPDDLRRGIRIQVPEHGFDPATVAIIVAFAPAINHVAITIWDALILPRIHRRLGGDALGEEISRR